jgi:PAS domain S-box-containing protein
MTHSIPDRPLPKSPLPWLAGLLVVMNLILWLLVAYSIRSSYNHYTRVAETRVFTLAQSLNETVTGTIAKSDIALQTVIDEVLRQKGSGGIRVEALHRFMLRQKNRLPELDSIRFADANGNMVCSSDLQWDRALNIADRDYFIQLRNDPADALLIPRAMIGRITQKKVLPLVRAVILADGSFGGVMIAVLPVTHFEQLFSKVKIENRGYITLRGQGLRYITHYPRGADLDAAAEGIKPPEAWLKLLAKGEVEHGLFQADGEFDKIPFQYAYSRVDPYPLYVSVGLNQAKYLEGWRQGRMVTTLGATFISVISMLMGWLFYRNWQNSILSLLENRRQEQKYHIVADYAIEWEFWIAPDGSFIYCSPSCLQLTGYPAETFYTNPALLRQIIHPDDSSAWSDHQHIEEPNAAHAHLVLRLVTAAGETRWVEHACRAVPDEAGGSLGSRGSFRDITDRRQAEQDLLLLKEELEQRVAKRTTQLEAANNELEAFSYSISHDLRAPLRHINGFIELLGNQDTSSLNEKSQHYLQVIAESARKMGVLIDDLLSFSRMGRAEMMQTAVDMAKLVTEAQNELQSDLAGKNIDWETGPLPEVYGDPAMLRQVLINLLSNAVKYSRGRDPITIAVSCSRSETSGETICRVSDNGVGFDMRYVDKLFGLFQRLHSAEEFEGTGVGLANVRRIIQRHGGRTWAEGIVNGGATFYFSLPDVEKTKEQ